MFKNRFPQLGNHSCVEISKKEITIDTDLKKRTKWRCNKKRHVLTGMGLNQPIPLDAIFSDSIFFVQTNHMEQAGQLSVCKSISPH